MLSKICELSKLSETQPERFDIEGRALMVTKMAEMVLVTDVLCTHEEADLSMGILSETVITCPLHQAKFDLKNGTVLDGPNGTDPDTIPNLKTYSVVVRDGEVWADI